MGADMYHIRGTYKERGLTISFSCLNCASEFFTATVNGKLLNVDQDRRSSLGYLLITKGKNALVSEIKRMLRVSRNKARSCTYGFRVKGDASRYYYIRNLTANVDSLRGKLSVYKEVKDYFREQEWKVHTSTTTHLGADYKAESVTKEFAELDPDGLIRINITYSDELLVPIPEKKAMRKGA